jgi:hypothetical protein
VIRASTALHAWILDSASLAGGAAPFRLSFPRLAQSLTARASRLRMSWLCERAIEVLQGIQAVAVSVSHLSGNTNAVPHSSTTEAQYTRTITHNMPYVVTSCPRRGKARTRATSLTWRAGCPLAETLAGLGDTALATQARVTDQR